jgi:hypothetical protein
MLFDQPLDLVQLAPVEAVVARQLNRVEPEFGFVGTRLDMNVSWFLAFIAEEEKAEPPDTENGRHQRTRLVVATVASSCPSLA